MKTNLKQSACLLALATFGSFVFSACNSDPDEIQTLPSSATVRNFSLSKDDKILPNLDSVFFSIDLNTLEIFNADSLPFGTKIDGLVPVITTESASIVELTAKTPEGVDTTYNYLENTTDTVDFSQTVKMRVVSYNGANERNYTIRVNVHTVPTDTMVWRRFEAGNLPSVFNIVNAQHTTMSPDGTYYCMTMYQNEYSMAYTDDPAGSWSVSKIELPFTPDINSLTASTTALHVLSTYGELYTSTDRGQNWTSANLSVKSIIGAYGSRILGTVEDSAQGWQIVEYPSLNKTAMPSDFPVKNSSNSLTVKYEMAVSEQMYIVGGRTSDGNLTNAMWGYDGKTWAKISRVSLPEKLENMTVVPYFNIERDTISWRVSKARTVLLAMCGNKDGSVPNETVFMTRDFGLTWSKAPDALQIPTSVIPSRTYAHAFPYTSVKKAKTQKKALGGEVYQTEWKDTGYLHPAFRTSSRSRATEPVTEWDVPYVYLFGGVNAQGTTYNTVFRGVITALTLKPLQ